MKEVKGYNPSKDPRLINCKTECGNDKCYVRRYGLFAEKTCQNFVEPKITTNADRIRSMSDEELANELYFMFVAYDFRNPQSILDFLGEEATDDA